MYHSWKLTDQHFILSNKTTADVYEAEKKIICFNSYAKHNPLSYAVNKTLVRYDALSALGAGGNYPDISSIARIEAADYFLNEHEDTDERLRRLLGEESCTVVTGIDMAAFRYGKTLLWMRDKENDAPLETPDDMLALVVQCDRGPEGAVPVFINNEDIPSENSKGFSRKEYQSAPAFDYKAYLEDLCNFINADIFTPISQAGIVRFQLRAIHSRGRDINKMARLVEHHILSRRGLADELVFPLSLLSSSSFSSPHRHHLYSIAGDDGQTVGISSGINNMVLQIVRESQELLHFIVSLYRIYTALIERWRTRIGRIEKGSAKELLMYVFAGSPVMTKSQACNLTGKSFSAISEAFDQLEAAKVISPGKPIGRNQTFEAFEATILHHNVYKKRAVASHSRIS